MKNKGVLILLILVIFCVGVSMGSVFAIEDANFTDALTVNSNSEPISNIKLNDNDCNSLDEQQCVEKSLYSNEILSISENQTNLSSDYSTYDYQQEITIISNNYKVWNSDDYLEVELKYDSDNVYYEIYDEDNYLIYSEESMKTYPNYQFEQNSNIFNELPDGVYTCKLYTNTEYKNYRYIYGTEITWNVVKKTNKPKTTKVNPNHYVKYIKVGKYKIKVWSDDSLNTKKNKVIKFLNKHVKKGHIFKIKGYKFKVSASMYRKILYYKKFGYDGKVGYSNFKVKTNKVIKYKMPIFETRKYTKYVWKYIKVLSGSSRWGDGWSEYTPYDNSRYYNNGWKYYGSYNEYYSRGVDTYSKLKKKVKTTITKEVKVGYKTVKLRVYAWGVETHLNVGVQFRGTGNGYKNLPLTSYYMF